MFKKKRNVIWFCITFILLIVSDSLILGYATSAKVTKELRELNIKTT